MKTYIFPYYVSFGKLDSADGEIELNISERDAMLLEKSAKEGGRFSLSEDDSLSKLYDKILEAILAVEKEMILADPSSISNVLGRSDGYDEGMPESEAFIDSYLEDLTIGINYPKELQLLEKSLPIKKKQTRSDSVTIERAEAQNFVYEQNNKDKIVYIDDGKTLYFVPPQYAGTFIIQSSVRSLEGGSVFGPFKNRKKITEIIIEDGLSEIPDWAFDGCDSLERIVIPASVKRIGFNAFTKCSRLKCVELSEGVVEIDNTAFRFCFDLEELRFPSTVKTVSMHITTYQSGIRSVIFEGIRTTIDDTRCRGDEWDKITMHVRSGSEAELFAKAHDVKYKLID